MTLTDWIFSEKVTKCSKLDLAIRNVSDNECISILPKDIYTTTSDSPTHYIDVTCQLRIIVIKIKYDKSNFLKSMAYHFVVTHRLDWNLKYNVGKFTFSTNFRFIKCVIILVSNALKSSVKFLSKRHYFSPETFLLSIRPGDVFVVVSNSICNVNSIRMSYSYHSLAFECFKWKRLVPGTSTITD